ncbi:uncharacterized protein G2W53_008425 [Senna tora]|uniref:Uncharacterized protein n=1 Tax=Senna tora TaxID=362788 RepID=A0A834X8Q9_9FABA|nr:uncharacterized protein G2W53_008425 [Senna tora]
MSPPLELAFGGDQNHREKTLDEGWKRKDSSYVESTTPMYVLMEMRRRISMEEEEELP